MAFISSCCQPGYPKEKSKQVVFIKNLAFRALDGLTKGFADSG